MIIRLLARPLVYWLGWVYGALLCSSAGLLFLVTTESGAQWLLAQAKSWFPDRLVIKKLHGSLIGPLKLEGVQYNSPTLRLEIEQLQLQWVPALLFQGQLTLRELQIQGVSLNLPHTPAAPNQQKTAFAGFNLPFNLQIEQGQLRGLRLLAGKNPPLVVESLDLSGRTVGNQVIIKQLEVKALDATLQAYGWVQLVPTLPLELQLTWNYRLPSGTRWSGTGSAAGTLKALRLKQQLAAPLSGQLNAQLNDLETRPHWEAALQLTRAELGILAPAFPGHLAIELTNSGQFSAGVLTTQMKLARLTGQVRGYPLAASGELQWNGTRLDIKTLQLKSGNNKLNVQGQFSTQLALDATFQGQDLTSLWPGLAGSLTAQGRLFGSRAQPQLEMHINGNNLVYQTQRVDHLDLQANFGLLTGAKLELNLRAEKLCLANQNWNRLELKLQGNREQHTVHLSLDGHAVPTGRLELVAGLSAEQTWKGTLQRLDVQLPQQEAWQLEQPTPFHLSRTQQHLDPLCLRAPAGTVCAAFQQALGQGWNAQFNVPQLSLIVLKPWLPSDWQLTGQAAFQTQAQADARGSVRGTAQLKLPQATLSLQLAGEKQQVNFAGTAVSGHLDAAGATAALTLPVAGVGQLRGEVQLAGVDPTHWNLATQPLAGRLQGRLDTLGFLSVLVPRLSNIQGQVEMDYRLAGYLVTPQAHGYAQLVNGALDVPELGLRLRELKLRLAAPESLTAPNRLLLEGRVRSGTGELRVQGETQLNPAAGFPSEIRVEGQDWVAVDVPEAEVRVAPQLTLRYQNGRADLEGDIQVPSGRIRPHALPASAVSKSADLVITRHNSPAAPPPKVTNFHAALRLILGEQVHFDGFGLRGRLTGQLLIQDEPGRPVLGRGRLGILEGVYRAYGQDLQIQRGYALFADGPVDNPGLDVQAVRTVDTITAGLRVNGNLKVPQVSLFSTPAMTQSEIAAYLLTGAPPGKAGAGQIGLVAALSASGAGAMTGDIARQLGLEELRLESSTLQGAALVAGTYLAPRLYVQYVNTLASRETVVRLRYDLTKHLQLQTETGKAQGVDLFYTHEH